MHTGGPISHQKNLLPTKVQFPAQSLKLIASQRTLPNKTHFKLRLRHADASCHIEGADMRSRAFWGSLHVPVIWQLAGALLYRHFSMHLHGVPKDSGNCTPRSSAHAVYKNRSNRLLPHNIECNVCICTCSLTVGADRRKKSHADRHLCRVHSGVAKNRSLEVRDAPTSWRCLSSSCCF